MYTTTTVDQYEEGEAVEKRVLLKECKNGTKIYGTKTFCEKCGGSGKVIWSYADHVCFDCDGAGWYWTKEYEMTPEHKAQLEAKRAKKEAERQAEIERNRLEREALEAQRRAESEAFEAKRRGHYYGEIGQKIEIEVTFVGYAEFSTFYGTTYVYKFDTDDGAHLVWKTSVVLGDKERLLILEGDRLTIKASIKDHKEYHGIEQTELQRVKIVSGGSKFYELSREELIEAEKLQNDYGWNSEEHLTWLRAHQIAHEQSLKEEE